MRRLDAHWRLYPRESGVAEARSALQSVRPLLQRVMDAPLTPEELAWLERLDTDTPVKPDVPGPIGKRLAELGLALPLVEGGLQLTALGRERLSKAKSR